MKKITGKVVSLVLALALVVSSFSANFAFASTKTISGIVTDTKHDDLYLTKGDKKNVDLKDWLIGGNFEMETKDHEDVTSPKIKAVSHVSGDRLVSSSIDTDDETAELKLKNNTGKEVLSVLYEGDYSDDDYDYTVKARQELTVYVYDEDEIVFGEAGNPAAGEGLDEFETFAKNAGAEKDIGIYKAVQETNDKGELVSPKAKFEEVILVNPADKNKIKLEDLKSADGVEIPDDDDVLDQVYFYEMTNGDKDITITDFKKEATKGTDEKPGEKATATINDAAQEDSKAAITVTAKQVGTDLNNTVIKFAIDDKASAVTAEFAKAGENKTITVTGKDDALIVSAVIEALNAVTGEDGKTTIIEAKKADDQVADNTTVATEDVTLEKGEATQPGTPTPTTYNAVKSVLHAVVGKQNGEDASTGSVTINVKKLKEDKVENNVQLYKASSSSDDKYTLKTKIEKKVDVEALKDVDLNDNNSVTVKKKDSSTYLGDYKVKDCELVFPKNYKGTVTIDKDSNIKGITGSVGEVNVGDAKVDYIILDDGNVTVTDGKVNYIKTGEEDFNTTGKVTVNDGTVGDIDTTDVNDDVNGEVIIDGGTVGNIDSDFEVSIKSNDEDETVTVGVVTAPEIDAFADDAALNIKGIKANDDNGTFMLRGEKLTVDSIDLDHYDTTLQLGEDDDEFIGTIPAPANAEDATIELSDEDNDVKVKGNLDVETINIDSDSKASFDGKVTVESIEGDGQMKIVAGNLYVKEGVSSVTLKLADTALAVGTTVLKADKDAMDADDLDCFGFTLEKSTGNNIDTFKIKSLSFAGPSIDKASANIAKGYSETFTASAYPNGTSLPAGTTIKWELDGGSTDVFKLTTDGNTAKVEVVSLDQDFASENVTTLKAILCDKDGDEMDDYDAAECEITAIAVPEAVSDTTSNFALAQGSSYQFKITSATQPNFAVGTAGVFNSELVAKNGNDYFYKITATGKPGQEAGIYLNGEKLLVASVKAPAFKCDTTMKTTVKGSYTIKVTADKTPSFAVGTAGVFKAEFVSNKGNDYFYKITSTGKKGAEAGIYVNGVKAFVAVVG